MLHSCTYAYVRLTVEHHDITFLFINLEKYINKLELHVKEAGILV